MSDTWMNRLPRGSRAAQTMASTVLEQEAEPIIEPAAIKPEPVVIKAPEPVTARIIDVRKTALRVVALFTSASCATTSVYFSFLWFRASQPGIIASIMSVTVVATLTVAPEMAQTLVASRRYLTSLAVALVAAVAMLFSMSSTIGGIYNARTAKIELATGLDTDRVSDEASKAKADIIKGSLGRLSKSMATDQSAVSSYQLQIDASLASGESPTSRIMATLVANRNAAITRVRDGEVKLSNLESDLLSITARSISAETRIVRADFAAWLGDRFGLGADQMEFILAAFPAVFIDVISPVMLVVAFSL